MMQQAKHQDLNQEFPISLQPIPVELLDSHYLQANIDIDPIV